MLFNIFKDERNIKMSGGHVSIGFGFIQREKDELQELSHLIEYLYSLGLSEETLKFSLDEEGEEWRESLVHHLTTINELSSLLLNHFYGELQGRINIFNLTNIYIRITVDREKDWFGFLLEFKENEMIKFYDEGYLQTLTGTIITFLKQMYNSIHYDYVFCDHEAEFVSPLDKVIHSKQLYSVLIIPEKSDFLVSLSSWHINGISERN